MTALATFELGTPAVLAFIFWLRPNARPRLAVILGALTPPTIWYVLGILAYISDPKDPGLQFVRTTGWLHTFPEYLISLLVGGALSRLQRPQSIRWRYAIGLVSAPAIVAILIVGFLAWAA
jgi:hypothetical protein